MISTVYSTINALINKYISRTRVLKNIFILYVKQERIHDFFIICGHEFHQGYE